MPTFSVIVDQATGDMFVVDRGGQRHLLDDLLEVEAAAFEGDALARELMRSLDLTESGCSHGGEVAGALAELARACCPACEEEAREQAALERMAGAAGP